MLSRDKKSILLLDNLIVDSNLLKHKEKISNINFGSSGMSTSGSFDLRSDINSSFNFSEFLRYNYHNEPSFILTFKLFIYNLFFARIFEDKDNKPKKDIELKELKEFFEQVKINTKNLNRSEINDVLSNYEKLVDSAVSNNQTALIEKINSYKEILKNEVVLATSRFDSFLEEKDIIQFYNKCSRHEKYNTNLKLTYIKNFVKYIPTEVSDLKKERKKKRRKKILSCLV